MTADGVESMWRELVQMCNDQFQTPPFKRLVNSKFSRERAQQYSIQMAYYVQNRRDCWGYVQGAAPLDVKAIIWKHEEDELINDPRCNSDHYMLTIHTAESLGLTREQVEKDGPFPLARAALYAWIYLA